MSSGFWVIHIGPVPPDDRFSITFRKARASFLFFLDEESVHGAGAVVAAQFFLGGLLVVADVIDIASLVHDVIQFFLLAHGSPP